MTTITLTPYGMATCSTCDAPTTHAFQDEDRCFYPQCAECARELKAAFPDTRIVLYSKGVVTE